MLRSAQFSTRALNANIQLSPAFRTKEFEMKRTILSALSVVLTAASLPIWAAPYEHQRIMQQRQSERVAAERAAAAASSDQSAARCRELVREELRR